MNKFYLVLYLFFLSSCIHENRKEKKTEKTLQETFETDDPTKNVNLPLGYTLDSLEEVDSLYKVRIGVIFPYKNQQPLTEYDRIAYANLHKIKAEFLNHVPAMHNFITRPTPVEYSYFSAYPISVYNRDSLVSYAFVIASSYEKSGTYADYYSFNYDARRKEEISFHRFFNLNSSQDTVQLLDVLNRHITVPETRVDSIPPAPDFCIQENHIVFNLSKHQLPALKQDLLQVKVPEKDLRTVIRKEFLRPE